MSTNMRDFKCRWFICVMFGRGVGTTCKNQPLSLGPCCEKQSMALLGSKASCFIVIKKHSLDSCAFLLLSILGSGHWPWWRPEWASDISYASGNAEDGLPYQQHHGPHQLHSRSGPGEDCWILLASGGKWCWSTIQELHQYAHCQRWVKDWTLLGPFSQCLLTHVSDKFWHELLICWFIRFLACPSHLGQVTMK